MPDKQLLRLLGEDKRYIYRAVAWMLTGSLCNTASRPPVGHPSSASADFDRFRNFKAIKIPENESFPGFFYIRSICSVFKKSDRI